MGSTASMIGRQPELTRLTELWERARTTNRAQWALVGGDAGMGKTTLVTTFIETLGTSALPTPALPTRTMPTTYRAGVDGADPAVLIGNCMPMGGESIPYAPIVGWMRTLLRRHGTDQVRQWAGPAGWETLGILLPGVGTKRPDGELERLQLSEAITAVLEGAATLAPLVVVIEDLHWADATTRQLARFLKSSLTDSSLVVLGSWRTDELHRRHPMRPWLTEMSRLPDLVRLDLEPLTEQDSAALARRTSRTDLSSSLLTTIVNRAEGIPFFIEELAHSAENGPELPWTLTEALMARVHQLDEDTQRILRLATGAGNRVDHRVLAAIAQTPDSEVTDHRLDLLLRKAMDASLLTPDDQGYCFRHALLAEAIHEDLLPGEHTRLHARYAALFAEHPDWDHGAERARHLFTSGQLTEAFEAAVTASRSAGLAQAESLAMLVRALEIWDQVPGAEQVAGSHDELLAEAAELARFVGEMDRGLAYIDASLAEGEELGVNAEVMSARLGIRARLLSNLLRPGALEAGHAAVARTDPLTPGLARMRALEGLSAIQMLEGDFVAAEASAAEGLAVEGEARRSPWHASLLNTHAVARVTLGNEDGGLAEMNLARPESGNHQTRLRYWINYSNELEIVGRLSEAVDVAQEGIQHARTIGREWTHGTMLIGNAAWPLLELGRWREAEALLARPRPVGPTTGAHLLHLMMLEATLAAWHGDLDRAEQVLAGLPFDLQTIPQRQYRMQYALAGALRGFLAGDPSVVTEHAAAIWAEPSRHKGPEVLKLAHLAAWAGRESGRTEAFVELRSALDQANPTNLGVVWMPLIEAEERDDLQGWEAAADTAKDPRIPVWVGVHVDAQRVRHQLARGDRPGAAALLNAAVATSEQIGLVPVTERLRAMRSRAGLDPARTTVKPPASSAHPAMTRRESEVLALLVAGKSNREIADELFISIKTASVHVTNIMGKLKVGNRGAAAALAREHDLV